MLMFDDHIRVFIIVGTHLFTIINKNQNIYSLVNKILAGRSVILIIRGSHYYCTSCSTYASLRRGKKSTSHSDSRTDDPKYNNDPTNTVFRY